MASSRETGASAAASAGLYATSADSPQGRWVWIGGLAPDISDAQLIERIGAHQAREGSGSTFDVHRFEGGAWVHFARPSLAHVCLTALNGTVLTGPKGSASTLRLRYAAHLEDTSAPPAVAYLKRPLPGAAALAAGSDEGKKVNGAAAPSARPSDPPAAKRARTFDNAQPSSSQQQQQQLQQQQPTAPAAAGAQSTSPPSQTGHSAPASAAVKTEPKPAAAAGRSAASASASSTAGTNGATISPSAPRAVAGGSAATRPPATLPGGPGTHADMLRLALRFGPTLIRMSPPAPLPPLTLRVVASHVPGCLCMVACACMGGWRMGPWHSSMPPAPWAWCYCSALHRMPLACNEPSQIRMSPQASPPPRPCPIRPPPRALRLAHMLPAPPRSPCARPRGADVRLLSLASQMAVCIHIHSKLDVDVALTEILQFLQSDERLPTRTRKAVQFLNGLRQQMVHAQTHASHPELFDCPLSAAAHDTAIAPIAAVYTLADVRRSFGDGFQERFWPIFRAFNCVLPAHAPEMALFGGSKRTSGISSMLPARQ